MKSALISAVVLAVSLTHSPHASAQDPAAKIVGVWKVTDIIRKEVVSGKIDKPYGEHPGGYWIYTAGGHFFWDYVTESRKKAAGAAPTDAERLELFKTMSFATGTYEIVGGKLVQQVDGSWIQSWTGTERSISLPEITGNKMTMTGAVFKHPISGVDAFTMTTFERVE